MQLVSNQLYSSKMSTAALKSTNKTRTHTHKHKLYNILNNPPTVHYCEWQTLHNTCKLSSKLHFNRNLFLRWPTSSVTVARPKNSITQLSTIAILSTKQCDHSTFPAFKPMHFPDSRFQSRRRCRLVSTSFPVRRDWNTTEAMHSGETSTQALVEF